VAVFVPRDYLDLSDDLYIAPEDHPTITSLGKNRSRKHDPLAGSELN
jgi:hypothetical protein